MTPDRWTFVPAVDCVVWIVVGFTMREEEKAMSTAPVSRTVIALQHRRERRLFLIETFTLRFDAMEDRLRLDATDKAGQIEGIWLTQRLTNKLVAALAQDLDRELAHSLTARTLDDPQQTAQAERPAAPPKAPPPQVAAALQGMAQHQLRLERARKGAATGARSPRDTTAVRTAPVTSCWLCTTIQLGPRAGGVMVSFTDDASVTARFFMSHCNTRAVLDGLADHYRRAGWPQQAFPDWVQDVAEITAGEEARGRLN